MWKKLSVIFFLFYLFALLQNSFFTHFSLLGATPNLVFILFFLLVFFSARGGPALGWENIFYAITAGLFLDLFSYSYFGVSIFLLLLIGFSAKKIQTMLQEKQNNKFPFVYFAPIFLISLTIYDVLFKFIISNFSLMQITPNLSGFFVAELVYNLLFAGVAFYLYKKFMQMDINTRQMALFKK